MTISLDTLTSWRFATWDQTVLVWVVHGQITGRGALRRVPGYEAHPLEDAATFSTLLP